MNFALSAQPLSPRLPLAVVVALAAIYLLTGLQHDPWKHEDAIHLGIAWGFLNSSDWLVPAIAGTPWPHTAPLYHWLAALLGKLFGGLLGFHVAARLATALFGALFLVALAGAARSFFGGNAGRIAVLLALGTLGLLLPLHEAQPGIAGLAFAALAWWGAGLILQGRRGGAVLLGLGLGLAFPAHGLAGLVMALAVLPAPILRRDWIGLALALLIAVPLAGAWPWALQHAAPEFWAQWWRNELAEATAGRHWPQGQHLEQLGWVSWPIWPLALWSLWLHRADAGRLALPLLGVLLALSWYLSGPPRTLALLPLLLPLLLVAASGADRLRRGAANAFDWFGWMTFTFFAVLIWLGASAQALGWPAKLARNFERLAPGHVVHYSYFVLAFAALLTTLWLLSWGLRRASWRPSLRWAGGLTLMWALIASLWMAWIDHYKSYRPVVQSLQAALPAGIDCIEQLGLGAAQRAVLDYYTGIRTVPASAGRQCAWRLVVAQRDRLLTPGWQEVWQGHRAGDRKERWYLDRRAD
ncbi:MAG: glycosyltransferase family 39 protein [Rhodocyclaceae bacterium]|nr:glycosyltransferase family 39 protein [Rhodocyclaceae bacterium]